MNSELDFSWSQTKESADRIFAQNTGKYLSDIEIKVLQGSWEGKSYEEIAKLTATVLNTSTKMSVTNCGTSFQKP
jgi:hypothetical protein